jgi:hypothetical protein
VRSLGSRPSVKNWPSLVILKSSFSRSFKLMSFNPLLAAFAETNNPIIAPNPELSMKLTFVKSSTTVLFSENSGLTVAFRNSIVFDVILPLQSTITSVGVVAVVRLSSGTETGFVAIATPSRLNIPVSVSTQKSLELYCPRAFLQCQNNLCEPAARGQDVAMAKRNRTRAIPNANANPYPKLSICIAFLFRIRSVAPTIHIPSPAKTGLTITLSPGILEG